MKKILKYVFIIILAGLLYGYFTIYPKLDIVSGFSAKSVASHLFIGGRTLAYTVANDNDVPSMNMAKSNVDLETRTVTSTALNIKTRKALYREGLGSVLIPIGADLKSSSTEKPNRNRTPKALAFPYGNLAQKDTVFDNVNYNKLQELVNSMFTNTTESTKKTRSILVIYKDQIIGEKYADHFSKSSLILGWSMAKSVTSTVLGVLAKEGKVKLDQTHLFDDWEEDKRKEISLRNLLNMNSGLEWQEDYTGITDVTKMLFLEADMSKPQVAKEQTGEANNSWNYSSGTSNLLSGFIRNQFSTQQAYLDYWYNELIDKIGMHSMLIESDFSVNFLGSSYGWANTRDWAKLGLLYLHEGNWNGEQIIDKSWVDFTRKPTNGSNGIYGGHFWMNAEGKYPDVPKDMYSCNGYQGQRVFIIPSKDLIVVRTGLVESPSFDVNGFLGGVCGTIRN